MRMVFKLKPLLLSPFSKSKPSPPLRIADVLLLQDHEEDSLLLMDGSRRIAARLLSALKRGKVAKRVIGDESKEDDVAPPDHETDAPDFSSGNNINFPIFYILAFEISNSNVFYLFKEAEICGKESNFNVGVGCCLLHLIAESKNELQKMKELKIQMENVLQNVKEGLLNTDILVCKNLESNDGDGVDESLGFNSNLTSNKVLFDQSLNCDDAPKDDCLEGMDRLEAELEVELERLLLHLDSGKSSTIPPEKNIKENTVNTTSVRSYNAEVIDPTIEAEEEDRPDSHGGVPPYELERKLHELLETRQEQQIRELETALETARQELREKEGEISWWKETAHLMLKHVKQPSGLKFPVRSTCSPTEVRKKGL
ncbi:protein POLAR LOCALIZATION DURING ASYMMETRIC DIVISION AND REDISTRIBUTION isoform X1 [Gossypium arboreum]|uniref:protein POLAR LOCALIZATION DURING ASYMMETRIC DIVISION AND REDISTRIBUTION isoform X1 n=1 Tax=Gossypium arboreum TaxID=29729 RepID=UPI0022F1A2AA|nr:protein POLAR LOCALIZATION DURING ASYMMETRIC DIVISION AND REDISTRIBUTION isoform X1 [Gossypium arboreum]